MNIMFWTLSIMAFSTILLIVVALSIFVVSAMTSLVKKVEDDIMNREHE